MINIVKRALQAMLPDDGELNGPWSDKYNGADLEKYIEGLSGQWTRDLENVNRIRYALDPYKTDALDELDFEFFNAPGELTETERRGRIDGRFQLMVETKLRLEIMERIFSLAGFTGVTFRTLGWNGVSETPQGFFGDVGQAFYGNKESAYGAKGMVYGATRATGDAYLITNGGSVVYAQNGAQAIVDLKTESWYYGAYFVCEGPSGTVLQIQQRLYETFWDLLYLVKPAKMHGILRAEFI